MVYGVKRFASDSAVTAGRVDLEGFDGVKAYQMSLKRDGTDIMNAAYGRKGRDTTSFSTRVFTQLESYKLS